MKGCQKAANSFSSFPLVGKDGIVHPWKVGSNCVANLHATVHTEAAVRATEVYTILTAVSLTLDLSSVIPLCLVFSIAC